MPKVVRRLPNFLAGLLLVALLWTVAVVGLLFGEKEIVE